jgi:hypothetical protein
MRMKIIIRKKILKIMIKIKRKNLINPRTIIIMLHLGLPWLRINK